MYLNVLGVAIAFALKLGVFHECKSSAAITIIQRKEFMGNYLYRKFGLTFY
jgi:hypothetical protein